MESQKNTYDESQIQVLEGLEAVRKRPGMYIGSTGTKGLHHLVYEIVDNSIDEALMGCCSEIYVSINQDNSITVIDNGRGIPCGIHPKKGISTLEVILSTLHAGGKFGNGGYSKSGGLHGVGASVVNALSIEFIAIVKRDGNMYRQSYSKGKKTSKVEIIGKSDTTGTRIDFTPDNSIFSDIKYDYDVLEERIKELALLNKNIKIILEDKREGIEQLKEFQFKGGIVEFVSFLNKDKESLTQDILYIEGEQQNCNVEIAFQYIDSFQSNIKSFVNRINTIEGGYHVNGFYQTLAKSFTTFARNNDILKNKDIDFANEDVIDGLTAIISTRVEEPEFEGQTKTKLGNTFVKTVVSNILKDYLEIYFLEHKEESIEITNKILKNQQLRLSNKKSKQSNKNNKKVKVLPSKLTDATGDDITTHEIYVVEGDSSGGNVKQGCKSSFQGVLKSRGKILNVEKQLFDRVASSEELKNFSLAIGLEPNEKYDKNKLRYYSVMLLQDADLDGGHIRALWITYLFRYYKDLILNGHVYACCPPLYKNEITSKNVIYTYTEEEQLEFLKTHKPQNIQRFKGIGEMSPEQLWDTTLDPKTRKTKQLTVEDCKEADEVISLLMGDKVEPRKEFIINNSTLATLDI